MADLLTLPNDAAAIAGPGYLERANREAYSIGLALGRYMRVEEPFGLLDIGCGLAAVDAYLCKAFPIIKVALLDGSAPGKKSSYGDGATAWNDVSIGASVVYHNTKIQAIQLHPDAFEFPHVSVILSLRSWCHHYPASVYLNRVSNALIPGGIMIVDCRKETDNQAILERSGFKLLDCLEESPKRNRMVFKRKNFSKES